jgi:hypothetical protein
LDFLTSVTNKIFAYSNAFTENFDLRAVMDYLMKHESGIDTTSFNKGETVVRDFVSSLVEFIKKVFVGFKGVLPNP